MCIGSISRGREINVFSDARTSSIDVKSLARRACKLFFEKKHRGWIKLAAKEVYSKEVLIGYLAEALGLDKLIVFRRAYKRICICAVIALDSMCFKENILDNCGFNNLYKRSSNSSASDAFS